MVTPASRTGYWWLHVICDNDLGRYYRYWLIKKYGIWNIMKPKWGNHITVIRQEKVSYDSLKKWNEHMVEFDYNPCDLQTNSKHFWLRVRCDRLKDIRERIDLSREPRAPLHMTFGVLPGGFNFYP